MLKKFFSSFSVLAMLVGIAFFAYPFQLHAQDVPNCELFPRSNNVIFNPPIIVTCDQPMDVNSITNSITLSPNIVLGQPNIMSDRTFIFTPPVLSNNTNFTITLSANAKSVFDTPISAPVNQVFKTADDLFAIFMDSHNPDHLQTNVDTALQLGPISGIQVTYPAPMDDVSVVLYPNTPGDMIQDPDALGTQWYFQPQGGGLLPNTDYLVTVSGTLQGNELSLDEYFVFRTADAPPPDAPAPDAIAPTVISTDPVNNATDVETNSPIRITFSEDINPQSVSLSFQDVTDNVPVNHETRMVNASVLEIVPPILQNGLWLAYAHDYALTVTSVQDLEANQMEAPFLLNFTVMSEPDMAGPTVLSSVPSNNAVDVLLNQAVEIVFDKSINEDSVSVGFNDTTTNLPVAHGVSYNDATTTLTLTPDELLISGNSFSVEVNAEDLIGNEMDAPYSIVFTTIAPAGPDETPPSVLNTAPANLAVNVVAYPAITITASEAVKNTLSVSFKKIVNDQVDVNFNLTHPTLSTFVITPVDFLDPNAEYRIEYSGIEDLAGNTLDADGVIHFSTANQTVFPSAVAHADYLYNTTLNANGNQPAWLNAVPDGFEASANDADVAPGMYSFMVTDAQNVATSAVLTVVDPTFMFNPDGQLNITPLLAQIVTQANADPLDTGLSSVFHQLMWLLSAANILEQSGWKP